MRKFVKLSFINKFDKINNIDSEVIKNISSGEKLSNILFFILFPNIYGLLNEDFLYHKLIILFSLLILSFLLIIFLNFEIFLEKNEII